MNLQSDSTPCYAKFLKVEWRLDECGMKTWAASPNYSLSQWSVWICAKFQARPSPVQRVPKIPLWVSADSARRPDSAGSTCTDSTDTTRPSVVSLCSVLWVTYKIDRHHNLSRRHRWPLCGLQVFALSDLQCQRHLHFSIFRTDYSLG